MIELENKENPMVKSILDNLSSVIETLKKEIANIDEEFKKKLDEAKKSLNACLEETQKQYDYWSTLSDVNINAPVRRRRRKTVAPEPVQDVVAESENPSDNLPFGDAVEAEAAEDVVVDDTVDSADEPESDGAGFTEEDNVKPEEELEDFPTDDEEIEESESDEEVKDDEDEWEEDFPEEWK